METAHSKVHKGFHPLSYQTKAYNKSRKSLSTFTQEKREFLECYFWLRHVPGFFNLKNLSCVMNDAEAENETEHNLKNFKLDNESLRYPDASTLQSLIPYVSRLVGLLPHIREKVNYQLSSLCIRNKVYQYETQRYVSKNEESALDFSPSAFCVNEFLTSDQQIWQLCMTDADAWSGITKVYWVLKKTSCTPEYCSEGNYNILEIKGLITVNRMINVKELLESIQTPYLLMITCGNSQQVNDEIRDIFKELSSILKQKNMKIILTMQSDDTKADFIQTNSHRNTRRRVYYNR